MAADMWSVGALTTALYLGQSYFVARESSAYRRNESTAILNAIVKCDLKDLDHNVLWQAVSQDARDFIRSLLVLDEIVRLRVAQALRHKWFTREDRWLQLDQNYQRVIKGWVPTNPAPDFEENLAHFIAAHKLTNDVSICPYRSINVDLFQGKIYASTSKARAKTCYQTQRLWNFLYESSDESLLRAVDRLQRR